MEGCCHDCGVLADLVEHGLRGNDVEGADRAQDGYGDPPAEFLDVAGGVRPGPKATDSEPVQCQFECNRGDRHNRGTGLSGFVTMSECAAIGR